MSEASARHYAVFISYRHADNREMGRKWANWLHEALESYEVPPDLVGTINQRGDKVPSSLYPVFRDEEELPADADLSANIRRALENSGLLVVLCSPRAVESRFVDDEIRYFKSLGKSDRILALMIDGEPNASDDPAKSARFGPEAECFPEPLRFGVADADNPRRIDWSARTEPIAADARPGGRCEQGWTTAAAYLEHLDKAGRLTERQRKEAASELGERLELAKLKIVAGALGMPLGALSQRDKAMQIAKAKHRAKVLRRWLAAVGLFGLAATIAGAVSVIQTREVRRQKERAEQLLWDASHGDHEAALLAALRARQDESLPHFERSLRYMPANAVALAASASHAYGPGAPLWRNRLLPAVVRSLAFSPDGRQVVKAHADRTITIEDMATAGEIGRISFNAVAELLVFSGDSRYFAAALADGTVHVIEAATGGRVSGSKPGGQVNLISLSEGGRYLAIACKNRFAALMEAATGRSIARVPFAGEITRQEFSRDEQHFVMESTGPSPSATVIDTGTGEDAAKSLFGDGLLMLRFSPGGRFIAACGDDKNLRILDARTKREISRVTVESAGARAWFTPEDHRLVVLDNNNIARVLDPARGSLIGEVPMGGVMRTLAFSPDGRFGAFGFLDQNLRLINLDAAREAGKIVFDAGVNAVDFSPDARLMAVVDFSGVPRVFDVETRKEVARLQVGDMVAGAWFSPDGQLLAIKSWGEGQGVRVAEPVAPAESLKLGLDDMVNSVCFSPDGLTLAVGTFGQSDLSKASTQKGAIYLLDAGTGAQRKRVVLDQMARSVSFRGDGRQLAVATGDFDGKQGEVRVIDAASGKTLSSARLDAPATSASFSPDGRAVAATAGKKILLLEAGTGREIRSASFADEVNSASFGPDGRWLAVGCSDGTVSVSEAGSGKEAAHAKFESAVSSVSFSTDGRLIAAVCANNQVHILDAATGRETSKVTFQSSIRSAQFSLDGRHLVSGSWHDAATIADIATGKEIARIPCGGRMATVDVSRDGGRLALGSWDKTVRVFDWSWLRSSDATASPGWLAALQNLSERRFAPDGRIQTLSFDDLSKNQSSLERSIRRAASSGEHWQHAILAWADQPLKVRTTTPWSSTPLRLTAGRWFMQASEAALTAMPETRSYFPWHPLEPLALARVEKSKSADIDDKSGPLSSRRTSFLASLTLKRLRDADERIYGRETLSEYAAWSAKVMLEELSLKAEAREAFALALEHTPPDKQEMLMKLKDKLRSE